MVDPSVGDGSEEEYARPSLSLPKEGTLPSIVAAKSAESVPPIGRSTSTSFQPAVSKVRTALRAVQRRFAPSCLVKGFETGARREQ